MLNIVLYNFVRNVLLYTSNYEGNPMNIHQQLNWVVPLTKHHFNRWIFLFIQTVDELFYGNNALLAKQKAINIATVMQAKLMELRS